MTAASKPAGQKNQKGGFVLGLIVGLLVGLAVALGVALYITKVPIPFVNKVPQRTAEQDAQEAERNRNWDPNAPLAGKAARSASGVVNAPVASVPPPPSTTASAAAATASAAATTALPTPKPPAAKAETPAATPASAPAATAGADAYVYFVQAGAFTRPEEAEAQKAKLAIQGFTAKVMEREQNGRTVFRVRLGPNDTREAAEDLQRKIEAAGFEANLVRVQR
ncbi:cell division protein FtsN [Pelomonas saccharophila]|uniref:Cell division protein FtsN n=1 Tax=Roseateles saccharophilus TaxID=304 RepID=A0ABU1YXB3_ROSSA|nr:SPOR domain-containing protein [Roseateles saccharophilus]MDR7272885.1 cell division protein FtsN [Roseateles saccharophilus]